MIDQLQTTELPSPAEVKAAYPLPSNARAFIQKSRQTAAAILEGEEDRLVAIVGPCSIHDRESAVEYALRLAQFSAEIDRKFFLIMRFFIEKPRSRLGWKGLIYDPHLDGSNDIAEGLRQSRRLLVEMAEMGIPCATEFLEPVIVPYFEDLITWGLIGARTSASQPHRQMASGLPFPIGFKNDFNGELDVAISGILTAQREHSLITINEWGKIAACQTGGNPLAHLVLRGSEKGPNYDAASISIALKTLRAAELPPRLLIDCSHGNSGKDPQQQRKVFSEVMRQVKEGNRAIRGMMIESHLQNGKQSLEDPTSLQYGLSITDPCLSWEETADLIEGV